MANAKRLGSFACVNCGNSQTRRGTIKKDAMGNSKIDGAIFICTRCEYVFFENCYVDQDRKLRAINLEASSRAAEQDDQDFVRSLSFANGAGFILSGEPLPSTAQYKIIIGRDVLGPVGLDLLMTFFAIMMSNTFKGKEIKQFVTIGVSGYEEDPRGLWELLQVRQWFAQVHEAYRNIAFWLDPSFIQLYFQIVANGMSKSYASQLKSRLAGSPQLSAGFSFVQDPTVPRQIKNFALLGLDVFHAGNALVEGYLPIWGVDMATANRLIDAATARINNALMAGDPDANASVMLQTTQRSVIVEADTLEQARKLVMKGAPSGYRLVEEIVLAGGQPIEADVYHVDVEAESLNRAEKLLSNKTRSGYKIVRKEVIPEIEDTATIEAPNASEADAKAAESTPPDLSIYSKEVVQKPQTRTVSFDVSDTMEIDEIAIAKCRDLHRVDPLQLLDVKLVSEPKKGFFGLGSRLARYEATLLIKPAILELAYCRKVRIIASIKSEEVVGWTRLQGIVQWNGRI